MLAIQSSPPPASLPTRYSISVARSSALRATGGGTANAVERDTENGGTWEVEITGNDGKTVDVRLDENYKVLVVEGDGENDSHEGESEGGGN